ncbi:hypothetical protein DAPPUDRAFT_237872 [Daphnia pulex]|uniref:Uncharacterized protein n=1 Tax=Daphnia pulex TaxID=6669 RepID=E9G4M4_DAPPU|nr:hypothetical protein DAPPUDRAFT_237872 [Daphnia pulex]|eukprot:EFX85322.1 hypothetical protein DAPPUDRAFT_237872 [Daphnia pulex]
MHQDQLDKISNQHLQEVRSLHGHYEKVIAVKVDQLHVESEQLSISHQKAIEDLQSRSSVELQELQDEFRMTFTALEQKLAIKKENVAQAHAKEFQAALAAAEAKETQHKAEAYCTSHVKYSNCQSCYCTSRSIANLYFFLKKYFVVC